MLVQLSTTPMLVEVVIRFTDGSMSSIVNCVLRVKRHFRTRRAPGWGAFVTSLCGASALDAATCWPGRRQIGTPHFEQG